MAKPKSNQIFITLSALRRSVYNEWQGPSPRLSAWATQVAAVASRWRHCADPTDLGFQPKTSRTDSVCAKQLS